LRQQLGSPPRASSKLEAAIFAAVAEGRKCYDHMDESEMTVAIDGSSTGTPCHRIGNVRGGAIEVLVDRQSSEVESAICYQ
jgi:hypothetical protein